MVPATSHEKSMPNDLYTDHVRTRREAAERVLAATGFEALVVDSGRPFRYYADDMDAPHHEGPHFVHWVPLQGPHHLLLVRPDERPLVVRVAPEDYWYEKAPLGSPFWAEELDVREVGTREQAWELVRSALEGAAYVGDAPDEARAHGVAPSGLNPAAMVARLDWDRSFKTPYEVACIEEAQVMAARGHVAAKASFEGGASELEIHQAYVAAVGCVDKELPYESIVALDEKGAILHYTGKRATRGGKVLLIDSGARHLGYCSDITRTWTLPGVDPVFARLVEGMDELQQTLCETVRPGLAYVEVHHKAHLWIGDLLHEVGILGVGGEEAFSKGLTRPFFPHGLGHFLGIQVHDVAGHQRDRSGGVVEAPAEHPFLRTTRTIETDQVFTVEPGIYFIEMLLREHRDGPHAGLFDRALVERMKGCGGVRIEDNLLVTRDGHRNLTRPHV